MSHTIRLRGFWEVAGEGEEFTHSRSFGRPRLTNPAERVWLTCSLLPALARVTLNGEPIATTTTTGPFAADITPLLRERNRVGFRMRGPEGPGEVALQIRPASS